MASRELMQAVLEEIFQSGVNVGQVRSQILASYERVVFESLSLVDKTTKKCTQQYLKDRCNVHWPEA